jgi:hypothetical protein
MSQARVARASVRTAWGRVPDFEPFAQNAGGSFCFFHNRGFQKEDRWETLPVIRALGGFHVNCL